MGPNTQINRSKRHLILLSCIESKKPKRDDAGADVSSRILSVKDLRSRRIFSQPSIGGAADDLGFQVEGPKRFGDLGSDCNGKNSELRPTLGDGNGDSVVGSTCQAKLVVKSSFRGTVFKMPGSNRYRKLLPFLMDIANEGIPKVEKNSFGTQNSNGTASELPKVMGNFCLSEDEDKSASSDGLKSLKTEEVKNYGIELSSDANILNVPNISKTEGGTQLHGDQNRNDKSQSSNKIEEFTKEHAVSKPDEIDWGICSIVHDCNAEEPTNSSIVQSTDPKGENKCEKGLEPLENGDPKNPLSCEVMDTDNLNLSGNKEGIKLDNEGIKLDDKDQKSNENGGILDETDKYEHIQTTPPDIISNLEVKLVENEENLKREIGFENYGFSIENSHKEDTCSKNGSNFKNKVLNPCSLQKILKTQGSFIHRRLLPYLMEVSNNNPYNSQGIYASKNPQRPKGKNGADNKKQNINLPMVELSCQKIPISTKGYLELDPPTNIHLSDGEFSDNKLLPISAEKSIELQNHLISENEFVLPVEQVISNVIKELEHHSGGENPKTESASPDILSCTSSDNEIIHRDVPHKLYSSEFKIKSSLDESFSPENNDNLKGILRTNPRRCRGLCSCLNCTSYRLHADRAFEFSRNQMLDAEELTLDLIKELSNLRNILKESTVISNRKTTANIDQVKVACSKALKAEESAKFRLKEMQLDLNVHCRSKILERPRVKFANHVKELVISED